MAGKRLTRSSLLYDLPPGLIAQRPAPGRSSSRLLVADPQAGRLTDSVFEDLPRHLLPGDLLVLNDTRVFRARLCGRKAATGGRAELFLLKNTEEDLWKVMIRPGRAAREGLRIDFRNGLNCTVLKNLGSGRAVVRFGPAGNAGEMLNSTATVPLPPYIRRAPDDLDDVRYQTVYARRSGAVAAPTAGLHFTEELLLELESRGIGIAFITLHVGPGTFQPLRSESLEGNVLEAEEYCVPAETLGAIRRTRSEGGRIIAVGTTTTRVLETVDTSSEGPLSGETDLFIFPPYRFRTVDTLVTNFHLPGSSLLCLVAAFMGYGFMMDAYRHAIERSYRFYSYGDAMLVAKESAE